VRKIHEGLVRDQLLHGDLLDAQDQRAGGEILVDFGAGGLVLVVGEDPLFGGLHDEVDLGVVGEDFLEVGGGERGAALPDALVLPADADPVFLLHSNNNPFTIMDE
jgi:hypothetical protein